MTRTLIFAVLALALSACSSPEHEARKPVSGYVSAPVDLSGSFYLQPVPAPAWTGPWPATQRVAPARIPYYGSLPSQ